MTLFAFESMEESRQRKLFTILEVDCFSTHSLWVNFPLMAIVGIVIVLIFSPINQLLSQVMVGVGFGLLIIASSFCHGLGHILSSPIVNAPMKSLILTATANIAQFEDEEEQTSRVHVGRGRYSTSCWV